MFKAYNFLKIIIFSLIVWACTEKANPDPKPDLIQAETLPVKEPTGKEQYTKLKSDYVYNEDVVRDYEILIKPTDWNRINNEPAKEEYVQAAIILEGDTLSPVQIRYKGSIGAYFGCVSGPDWSRPSGYKTCAKLSMQVKMTADNRKEKFYGLNKLQFHSQNNDRSQLREKLGYWLFREMGVPAPRSVHARLKINGQYQGLFGLTEEIDNRFAEYFYPNGKGNIYKEIWPIKDNGNANSASAFVNKLRTNEENPDVTFIKGISDELQQSSETEAKAWVKKYMDIDAIMAYIAVDRTIRHDDGPFHWYCDGNGNNCSSHNFYWFEDTKNKKIHMVPWDLDGAFDHIIANQNPVTPIADKWGQISNNCVGFSTPGSTLKQKSAACDKLTAAWVTYKPEYENALKVLKSKYLTNEQAKAKIDKWSKLIEPYIKEADNFYNIQGSNFKATNYSTWTNGITTLKNQVSVASF